MTSLRLIPLILIALTSVLQSRMPAATLSLVDANNLSQGTLTIARGNSFIASAYVQGLSALQPLDAFDIQLASLPSEITLLSITSAQTYWSISPNVATNYASGYANSLSQDLAGNAVLLNFTFNVAANTAIADYTIDFAPGALTMLYDSTSTSISFSHTSLNVHVVPEPRLLWLLASTLIVFIATRRLCLRQQPIG